MEIDCIARWEHNTECSVWREAYEVEIKKVFPTMKVLDMYVDNDLQLCLVYTHGEMDGEQLFVWDGWIKDR